MGISSQSAIIIQARSESKRLPKKILLNYYCGKSILQLILEKLIESLGEIKIIVATTRNPADNEIIQQIENYEVEIYRGSEENVLKRFIDAADNFGVERIIRICADNPFVSIDGIKKLISYEFSEFDYVAFRMGNGLPSIKSHIGLYAEMVKNDCLKKILEEHIQDRHLEHVTTYIYENEERFRIKWLEIPKCLKSRDDIRLTVDTLEDFHVSQKLNSLFMKNPSQSLESLVELIDNNSNILDAMKLQIKLNKK